MNKKYLLILLFVVFGKSFANLPRCPNTAIIRDLTNLEVLKYLQLKALNGVWNSNEVWPQTPLSSVLKDVLGLMITSDSRKLRTIAFLHTFRMATILTEPVENINFCSYAKTINSSVTLSQNGDLKLGAQAIQGLADAVKYLIPLMSKASLEQAGCNNFLPVNVPAETCFNNGLTFNMEGLWNIYGKLLPHTFKDIVFKLYASSDVIDRAHAVLVSAAIPDIGQELFDAHPPRPLLESFATLTTGPVPPRCCAELRIKTDSLNDLHNKLVQHNGRKIINEKYSVLRGRR